MAVHGASRSFGPGNGLDSPGSVHAAALILPTSLSSTQFRRQFSTPSFVSQQALPFRADQKCPQQLAKQSISSNFHPAPTAPSRRAPSLASYPPKFATASSTMLLQTTRTLPICMTMRPVTDDPTT